MKEVLNQFFSSAPFWEEFSLVTKTIGKKIENHRYEFMNRRGTHIVLYLDLIGEKKHVCAICNGWVVIQNMNFDTSDELNFILTHDNLIGYAYRKHNS